MLNVDNNRRGRNKHGTLSVLSSYQSANLNLPPGTSQSALSTQAAELTKSQMRAQNAYKNLHRIAQEEAERINFQALRKVKKMKLSEKVQKEMAFMKKQQIEKSRKNIEQAQKIV